MSITKKYDIITLMSVSEATCTICKIRSFAIVQVLNRHDICHIFGLLTKQALGQDGKILSKFILCVFMDRKGVKVYKKHSQKGPISGHLDRKS